MRSICVLTTALGVGLGPAAQAQAQTITVPDMTFERRQAIAPLCTVDCPEWIQAKGKIVKGTLTKLKAALARNGGRKIPILISSPGGDVEESYAIGRYIRSRGIAVSTGTTAATACPLTLDVCKDLQVKKVEPGQPGDGGICASSCVFILAGGAQRNIPPTARLGVHQFKASAPNAGDRKVPDAAYDRAEDYFAEMGVTNVLMPFIRKTPHDKIHELTPAQIGQAKLATARRPLNEFVGLTPGGAPAAPATASTASAVGLSVGGAAPTASADDADLGLKIQRQLLALKCLPGKADGVWDERTREALRRFADASRLSQIFTAEPDTDTLRKVTIAKAACAAG